LPCDPPHRLYIEHISSSVTRSSLSSKLFQPARLMHGHDPCNCPAPVGHLNDLARRDPTQDRSCVLTKLSDSDLVHVAHCSTFRRRCAYIGLLGSHLDGDGASLTACCTSLRKRIGECARRSLTRQRGIIEQMFLVAPAGFEATVAIPILRCRLRDLEVRNGFARPRLRAARAGSPGRRAQE